jgi:hypothetical protein
MHKQEDKLLEEFEALKANTLTEQEAFSFNEADLNKDFTILRDLALSAEKQNKEEGVTKRRKLWRQEHCKRQRTRGEGYQGLWAIAWNRLGEQMRPFRRVK